MKDYQFCILIATLFLVGGHIDDNLGLFIFASVWTVLAAVSFLVERNRE